MMQLSTAMGNGKDTRPVSCTQTNHQEVTDDAENKSEGRQHLKRNNEAMKNFTAEKTLDGRMAGWGIAEDANDPILFICLQKGRKLKDNSCYTIGCIEVSERFLWFPVTKAVRINHENVQGYFTLKYFLLLFSTFTLIFFKILF